MSYLFSNSIIRALNLSVESFTSVPIIKVKGNSNRASFIMRKSLFLLSLISFALAQAGVASAQTNGAMQPPQISEQAAEAAYNNAQKPKRAPSGYDKLARESQRYEVNPDLAPTDADYAKARKDREEGRVEKPVGSRTQIETVRDQNNRITEYVVTPGSTRLPYSVENRSEYPASSAPGHSKDTLGIVNSRVRISKELCHDLLVNTGSFLFPLYKDDWQILLLDLNSIETVLNLIHEYTHKIHYFLLNGFDEETSVITEIVAYYNTATFIKYALENNISSYELNLAVNSTEFTIAEEIGSIPIYNFVEEQQDFNFLNEKEKELIARYFDMDYFPPSDYYHHLSYYLYKELFNKNRNFSIEEHTQYLKEVMCKKKVKELIKW